MRKWETKVLRNYCKCRHIILFFLTVTVLEVEHLKEKVVSDLESNEARLKEALQKVQDLQNNVQVK